MTTTAPRGTSQPFSTPGQGHGLVDVVRRRYLLRLLTSKETRIRYRGSVLGWVWSYIKPAAQFTVFYVALGIFLQLNRQIEGYPVYLFSGLILINLFSESFSNATKSLVDNAALIKKIYLPRELFPVASTIVALVHFVPQVVVLTVAALITGWTPNLLEIGAALLAIVVVITFATGLGLFFGSINVLFRDAQNFVELILLFATWASPVLYSFAEVARVLPAWGLFLYEINPLTVAVELFHRAFWFESAGKSAYTPPDLLQSSLIGLLLSLAMLFLGQLVFRRLEGRFAQEL